MKVTKLITLEFNSSNSNLMLEAHRGDKDSRVFYISLTVNGEFMTLTENMKATVNATINNIVVSEDVEVKIDVENNYIEFELTEKMLELSGILIVDLVLTGEIEGNTEIITAETFKIRVAESAINEKSKFISGGFTTEQQLKSKEDIANKISNFDSTFADESGKKYPTVLAIMKYLSDYYYSHNETYNADEINEMFKNVSGVHVGEEEPTDPSVFVWIKTDGESNVTDVSEVGM